MWMVQEETLVAYEIPSEYFFIKVILKEYNLFQKIISFSNKDAPVPLLLTFPQHLHNLIYFLHIVTALMNLPQ